MAKLLNVEIKARLRNEARVRKILSERGARVQGEDRQIDTYFHCASGRLKLRESRFADQLVFYARDNQAGPKRSDITLQELPAGHDMKTLLSNALGVLVVVDKRREIEWLDNIKVHIDDVPPLGRFVEIEAIDDSGAIGRERLEAQCEELMTAFAIAPTDLLTHSYSDMMLAWKPDA